MDDYRENSRLVMLSTPASQTHARTHDGMARQKGEREKLKRKIANEINVVHTQTRFYSRQREKERKTERETKNSNCPRKQQQQQHYV